MDEVFWKAGYCIVFLIWFGARGCYRHQAVQHPAKSQVRPGFESFLVALNFIGMTVLPLLAVFTPFLDALAFALPDPVRFIILVILAFSIWLFIAVHRDLGKNWSMILEIKEGHHLVKTGIYKKIRHPKYAHFWIWVVAQGFVLANGLVLAFGIAAWGLLYFLRVPREEEMLITEFGDGYRDYMNETGRVIPKF